MSGQNARRNPAEAGALLRVPPTSIEAERAVLGAILLDNGALDRLRDVVVPEDFYREAHRLTYRAMGDLRSEGREADILTIGDRLNAAGTLEQVGGLTYLNSLLDAVPTATNVSRYAEIVRDKSMLRALIALSAEAQATAYSEPEGADAVLDDFAGKLAEIAVRGRGGPGAEAVGVVVARVLQGVRDRAAAGRDLSGLATGFGRLDLATDGLGRGWLITLAGRPGSGKSALGWQLALAAAEDAQAPALVFSVEMTSDDLVARALAGEARIGATRLRSGRLLDSEWLPVADAAARLSRRRVFIDDEARTLGQVRARTRRFRAQQGGLAIVVVDYLQLMQGEQQRRGGSREEDVAGISRGLKSLAKELNIPVLALAQLNRKVEERTDKRPILSDLRESGSIEQDSDVVLMLYRDEYYNPQTERPGIADVFVRKHRFGPTGELSLYFDGATTRFFNIQDQPTGATA